MINFTLANILCEQLHKCAIYYEKNQQYRLRWTDATQKKLDHVANLRLILDMKRNA